MPQNPKLYRELCVPFPNEQAADDALKAFGKEFEQIRIKHRIADVIVLIQVNALDESGEEGLMSATLSYGDQLRKPMMLAQELGRTQAEYEDSIGRLLARKSLQKKLPL